jgi:L-ribulose-5-phosphate 3-epimerase
MEGFVKKSIGDNMIPKGWTFEQGLALIKAAGFDGVELWLGDVPWFTLKSSDADVEALRRKVDNAGLVVSNVSSGQHWTYSLSARDPKVRNEGIRIAERQIETAVLLKTDAILIVAGAVTEEVPYNEVYRRSVEAVQQLGEKAGRARVKIGCENNNSYQRFLMGPREFLLFLNEVNSSNVGIHLDVANIEDTGFPEQWIEILAPHIIRMHVRDSLINRGHCPGGTTSTNLFLGDINWRSVRDAITKVGYDGWIIAEMEARYRYAFDQQFYDTSVALDRLISGRF